MVDLSIVNKGEPHILLIIFNYNQLAVLFQNAAFDLAELVEPPRVRRRNMSSLAVMPARMHSSTRIWPFLISIWG